MNCDQCQQSFAASLEGLLAGEAERDFASHLADCPTCRADLEETRRLAARLAGLRTTRALPSIADAVADGIIREQARRLRRSSALRRRLVALSAACILLAGLILLSNGGPFRPGRQALADDLGPVAEAIRGVKTATWSVSHYKRFAGPGGVAPKWVRVGNNNQRFYYESPGRYRREDLDEDGKVIFVAVEDATSRAALEINPASRVATLRYLSESSYSPAGPFATFLESIGGDQLVSLGRARFGESEAEGYRCVFSVGRGNQAWSYDFWVDPSSKRLVEQRVPGADLFNPRDVVANRTCAASAEKVEIDGESYAVQVELGFGNGGSVVKDIATNRKIDSSLFRLDPPEGYAVRTVPMPPISEGDVTEFLGLVAGYFGGTFPPSILDFHGGGEYPRFERLEHDWLLKKPTGTAGEVALLEAMHRWWRQGVPGPGPLRMFADQWVVRGSWKYLGAGVKLGEAGRIVCWYRPRGSRTYHVIYGDLTVKEVAEADLPLPVGRPPQDDRRGRASMPKDAR